MPGIVGVWMKAETNVNNAQYSGPNFKSMIFWKYFQRMFMFMYETYCYNIHDISCLFLRGISGCSRDGQLFKALSPLRKQQTNLVQSVCSFDNGM